MPHLADIKTCTACMGCMNICPKNAIDQIQNKDGHYGIEVNPEKCIECGACERVCPIVNGSRYGTNCLQSTFLAGWSLDKEIRRRGATSGVAGTLGYHIISLGGYVAGAVMDGLTCKYILTNKIEDLKDIQGSKYTSSNPGFIFRSIKDKLALGKTVLFCGIPCHVGGLLEYLPERLKENLYTIDIICGGVSSPLLIKRYSDIHEDIFSIKSFRDKKEGWRANGFRYSLTYSDKGGNVIDTRDKGRNLITDGFACELTDRWTCYKCRFAKVERKSDMTIGDLWGDIDYKEEHFNGVSAIIVHSQRGMRLLENSGIKLHNISPIKILSNNSRIFNGNSIKRYFPERIFLSQGLRKLSYDNLMRVYASDIKKSAILWLPFGVYRIISFRIADYVRKIQNKLVLKKLFKNQSIPEDLSE